MFSYCGPIPASKSLLNRWLIVQSYVSAGSLVLHGESQADDVRLMRLALTDFKNGKNEFDCGAAGTVLRFLALRVSREKGEFILRGSKRLFERPQNELLNILLQLGVKAEINSEQAYLKISSQGWKVPNTPIEISGAESSQFASAVLLNTLGLEKALQIKFSDQLVSEAYFEMTKQVMQQTEKLVGKNIHIEPDMSSAFAIAALAALSGKCELQNFPHESLQPDFIFVELLKRMGAQVSFLNVALKVVSTKHLLPIEFNLKNAPDVFPVLATLCAFVEGKSVLFGAPHLRAKESDRIAKTAELIRLCGRKIEEREDGLVIFGNSQKPPTTKLTFDPVHDHRLVMAATLANAGGADIYILHPEVVNKSFPEFTVIARRSFACAQDDSMRPAFLIGHRGSGKTTLLQAVSKACPGVHCIDLDAEIEKQTGKSIPQIFAEEDETRFRELEREVLNDIIVAVGRGTACRAPTQYIALGAGFSGKLPQNSRVIWLRRDSDRKGRIFLDRPSLGKNQLAGFLERFDEREKNYSQLATETITLSEGNYTNEVALSILFGNVQNCGGFITVLPEHMHDQEKFLTWLESRLQFGFDGFELRDDLLLLEEIQFCLQHIPHENVLLSFRSKNSPALIFAKDYKIDWDISLGVCQVEKPFILSSHQQISKEATKVAMPVNSFAELLAGHKWQQEDPTRRSFLPMSPDGRWSWYRLLMKNRMPVNFLREASGSAADQPTLLEWISVPQKSEKFYAILGDPVDHSFSPSFHREFFARQGLPTLAVKVACEEWAEALPVLQELGLRFASVTSPLKQQAGGNTLSRHGANQSWNVTDTDTPAIEATLIKSLQDIKNKSEIAIWGSGAMAKQIKKLMPEVQIFSARESYFGHGANVPSVLVWAAGDEGNWPPEGWKPAQVFDLDYRLNSKGLQYAEKVGASYVSGLAFFEAQAKLQQEYWSSSSHL